MTEQSFRSILVANRGEIVVRVIRTARALGYRTVAVYSEADADASHVRAADDAVLIGPAPVTDSYLNIEHVLAAAENAGAQAVHPGYGFLSENAEFARACEAAGLVFIGPSPEAIELMGNKAEAKRRMLDAGVPCVPGYEGNDQSDAALVEAAARIGFPVMVKAAAGGGGRGMRLVAEPKALTEALAMARSEAENAFGSGEMILEKAIQRARHVEVQVFADTHGNVIHLGERDCSVQRRHQKVIEEAPCPVMTMDLRERMGSAAVAAARNIGYRGAGTVEFLLDASGAFYFLEMNTRLQVEHPVTEMTTGLDLVAMQIRVAEGNPLEVAQEDVRLSGHAIEARLYAEDPADGFLPSTGRIERWEPGRAEGVRVDAGIATGQEVSPFYDPMLAKVVAWGETRQLARCRLIDALDRTAVFGPHTNRDFLIAALTKETFARGNATTAFIEEEFPAAELAGAPATCELTAVAAALRFEHERSVAADRAVSMPAELLDWSSSGRLVSRFRLQDHSTDVELAVAATGGREYVITSIEGELTVHVVGEDAGAAEVRIDGRLHRALFCVPDPARIFLSMDGRSVCLQNAYAGACGAEEAAGGGHVRAPMHGMLLEVSGAVGREVRRGDRLAVLEAMKMQHEIRAEVDGTIREVLRSTGEQIAAGDVILEIEVAEDRAQDRDRD